MNEEFLHFRVVYTTDEEEQGFFDCTPDNTELYVHGDAFRDVDHLFHRFDQRDRRVGAFIWRHILKEKFDPIAHTMITSRNWPCRFNPVPLDSDMEQYAQDAMGVPDELPEDFS